MKVKTYYFEVVKNDLSVVVYTSIGPNDRQTYFLSIGDIITIEYSNTINTIVLKFKDIITPNYAFKIDNFAVITLEAVSKGYLINVTKNINIEDKLQKLGL